MSRSEVKCPKCGQEVQVYNGVDIEKHKIFTVKRGKKTTAYTWCTQKKVR
jgi:endogenous inhibitor of DNA gyrase (YacG/DUF329 family)